MEYQLNQVTEEVEYGLLCPDGTVLWPPDTYRGYAFDTDEQRNGFAQILIGAAQELKIEPTVFIGAFGWVPREKTTYVVSKVHDGSVEMGHQWKVDEVPVDGESPDPKE